MQVVSDTLKKIKRHGFIEPTKILEICTHESTNNINTQSKSEFYQSMGTFIVKKIGCNLFQDLLVPTKTIPHLRWYTRALLQLTTLGKWEGGLGKKPHL